MFTKIKKFFKNEEALEGTMVAGAVASFGSILIPNGVGSAVAVTTGMAMMHVPMAVQVVKEALRTDWVCDSELDQQEYAMQNQANVVVERTTKNLPQATQSNRTYQRRENPYASLANYSPLDKVKGRRR